MIPTSTQDALTTELVEDEGEDFRVYDDDNGAYIARGSKLIGNPTIGVGRNLATNGISKAESRMLLANDIESTWNELLPVLPWLPNLSTARQVVILGIYFNTALHDPERFVKTGWPHFLAQMEAGMWVLAAQNLSTSEPWASEVGDRAIRYASMVQDG